MLELVNILLISELIYVEVALCVNLLLLELVEGYAHCSHIISIVA